MRRRTHRRSRRGPAHPFGRPAAGSTMSPSTHPSLGLLETNMSELSSATRQNRLEGQEIARSDLPGSIDACCQRGDVELGFTDVRTAPASSIATQNDADGQAIAVRARPASIVLRCPSGSAAPGSSVVSASPASSTATHSDMRPRSADGRHRRTPDASWGLRRRDQSSAPHPPRRGGARDARRCVEAVDQARRPRSRRSWIRRCEDVAELVDHHA
jgi:hypothetical protein